MGEVETCAVREKGAAEQGGHGSAPLPRHSHHQVSHRLASVHTSSATQEATLRYTVWFNIHNTI